jgi:hypothetical protein
MPEAADEEKEAGDERVLHHVLYIRSQALAFYPVAGAVVATPE